MCRERKREREREKHRNRKTLRGAWWGLHSIAAFPRREIRENDCVVCCYSLVVC